jgi:hypothetical protein
VDCGFVDLGFGFCVLRFGTWVVGRGTWDVIWIWDAGRGTWTQWTWDVGRAASPSLLVAIKAFAISGWLVDGGAVLIL